MYNKRKSIHETSIFLSVFLSENKISKNLSFYSFKIITNNISVKLSCSSYSDKYFVLSDNYGGDWGNVTCTMTQMSQREGCA